MLRFENGGQSLSFPPWKTWLRRRNRSTTLEKKNHTRTSDWSPIEPKAAGNQEETAEAKLVTDKSQVSITRLRQDLPVDSQIL